MSLLPKPELLWCPLHPGRRSATSSGTPVAAHWLECPAVWPHLHAVLVTTGSPLSGIQAPPSWFCPAQALILPLVSLVITSTLCPVPPEGSVGLFYITSSPILQISLQSRK